MGRIKKRGASGQAQNYITRTKAVRKLQVSLPDFRRLCIFKGIYPREPRNKKKAAKGSTPSTTFYYTKDIQYLLHEPLLQKFREHKALAKKIARALGRDEVGDAARLEKSTPRLTLDHVIKERYPTFVDALRDLDDCLSMLFLFSNLPSSATIPSKTISLCQRLCHEFEHYLIVSHSLRKSFLSIKGIYYQATIQGQDILWLVPYKFVQQVSGDVDFRIMATFVEFYTTLLGFVNFRLYTSVGLTYPPKLSSKSDEAGAELGAFTLEGRHFDDPQQQIEAPPANGNDAATAVATERAQDLAANLENGPEVRGDNKTTPSDAVDGDENNEETSTTIDTFMAAEADADVLPTPQSTVAEAARLFAPYTFFLSRETPRHPQELLLKAFGCPRVGWPTVLGAGAFTTDESNPAITHQVVDRPPQPVESSANVDSTTSISGTVRYPGRTYVQPQWIWDSVNAGALQRPDLYAPGATLPPHLSPWVKPSRGEYDPTAPLPVDENVPDATIGEIENGDAEGASNEEASSGLEEDEDMEGVDVAEADSDGQVEQDGDGWSGFSGDEDASGAAERQEDLEAESHGTSKVTKSKAQAPTKAQREQQRLRRSEEEELERRKMMMPRRKRKLYEKMAHGNAKRDDEAQKLRSKRRKLEAEKAAARL